MKNITFEISTTAHELYKRGWITTRDGNISVRDGGKIYITRSSVNKAKLSSADILEIDIVDNVPQTEGLNPSIEFHMHWLILKDVEQGAVIHAHPPMVVAAMDGDDSLLRPALKEYPELTRYTKVGKIVPFIAPGEHKLAEKVWKNIQGCDIVGLKKHGVTSKGKNLEEAFEHIERFSHVCEIILWSYK